MRNLLILASLLLAGCSSLQPTIDYDTSVDFSRLRSFSWVEENPVMFTAEKRPIDQRIERHLIEATRQSLEAKGFVFVERPQSADFAVGITVGSREGFRVQAYTGRSRYGGQFRGGYWSHAAPSVQTYREGQLAIDILDVALGRPVWHGTVGRPMTRQDRQNLSEAVAEFVDAILAKFPPGQP